MFDDNYGDEDGEAETDELWVTPGGSLVSIHGKRMRMGKCLVVPRKRLRCRGAWAKSIESSPAIAIAASTPILHPTVDQIHTHKQQQTASDDLGKDLVQLLRRDHAHSYLDPDCTEHAAENRTPSIGAWQLCSICCGGACTILVAHCGVVECNWQDVECWSDDGEEAGADEEWGLGDMNTGNLKSGCDTSRDECSGNEILGKFSVEVEGSACDRERRGDNRSDHGQGMLETEQDREKNGNLIVQAVEWCFIVFVFAIQGPDVGGDQVEIVLNICQLGSLRLRGRQT